MAEEMRMPKSVGAVEKAFFTELWRFRIQFYNCSTQWKELVTEMDRIGDLYSDDYYKKMLFLCLEDIEKRAKEREPNENQND